jgi:hypothetical protein
MKIAKINLMSKNNVKNGFYLYRPIVEIDGKFYFCESIKTSSPMKDIDKYTLKVTREIPSEFYKANGL